jgi:uncharacterized protein YhfF
MGSVPGARPYYAQSEERSMEIPIYPAQHFADWLARIGAAMPADLEPFMLGDTPALARELAQLVLQGQKRATAGLLWVWERDCGGPPRIGQQHVLHDWHGAPLALLENTRVEVVPFLAVSASFVREEGEGDGTLAWWRAAHWEFYGRECRRLGRALCEDVPVVCQSFRMLYPPVAIG